MKVEKRFCFVVSPIGKPDSIERKQADEFLALIKEVGELHGLDVRRADEIVGTSDITNDVVDMVRQADLCIIDLTNLNPNVMYEFGMRFQTGLPYIVCAKEDTKLPFDMITRRTIFYGDISSTQEARRVREQIREFVRVFEDKDYQNSDTKTMNDLFDMLQIILNKVSSQNMTGTPQYSAPSNDIINVDGELDDLLRQLEPSEAFHYAYSIRNVKLAEALLEYCRDQPFDFFFNKLCALTNLGSEKAAKELVQYLEKSIQEMENATILEAVGCLVTCYNRRDSEAEHIESMESLFSQALAKAKTNKERAAILNQKERLYAGKGDFVTAKEIANRVIELNDEEASYFFNYATVQKHLGDKVSALEYAKKSVEIAAEDDDDHLALLCELLMESDNPADSELVLTYLRRLEKVNPLKARLIRLKQR